MKQPSFFLAFCLFVIVGVPRIFSLDAHWSSDESRWLHRSAVFMDAVQVGHFEQTRVAHHPGVTTMWLAGFRQAFGTDEVWVSQQDLALARWFIGVAVLAGLVGGFFLLHRLFSYWPAMFAWAFLAIDPFFLAQSRRVHTDALATLFILLTVLLFIGYGVFPAQRRYLILAGVAFGLACLSKSYSLVLLLWVPVCLLLFRQSGQGWKQFFSHAFSSGLLFLNCSLLTSLALWPIFWTPLFGLLGLCLLGLTLLLTLAKHRMRVVLPCVASTVLIVAGFFALRAVWPVFSGIEWAVTTAHEVEHFFLGKVVYDPGWLFYLFALSIKSTPFVLPLAVLGVLFFWKRRQATPQAAQRFRIAVSLICGVLLFFVCLSLTSKKFSRYLLPIFPMLDVLAGVGLFYLMNWVGKQFRTARLGQVVQIACVVLVFALTAVPVVALHPYYGTYYNLCWKGVDIPELITVGEASGLDLAAKYLNKKPNARLLSVQVSPLGTEFFRYYFVGTAYRADKSLVEGTSQRRDADYEVVYIRDAQIGRVPQTGTRNGTLAHTVTLNGIAHVWIYRVSQKRQEE